jgi:hypothetical protein
VSGRKTQLERQHRRNNGVEVTPAAIVVFNTDESALLESPQNGIEASDLRFGPMKVPDDDAWSLVDEEPDSFYFRPGTGAIRRFFVHAAIVSDARVRNN